MTPTPESTPVTPTPTPESESESTKSKKHNTGSEAENEQLELCYNNFFASFSVSNDVEYLEEYTKIGKQWSGAKLACSNFRILQDCLKPNVIENCVNVKTFAVLFDYGVRMDSNYKILDFQCGKGLLARKTAYDCLLTSIFPCNIDYSTCESAKKTIMECAKGAKTECGPAAYYYIYNLYAISFQSVLPTCNFGEKELKYVPEKGSEEREPIDKINIDDVANAFNELFAEKGIPVEEKYISISDMAEIMDLIPQAMRNLNTEYSQTQHEGITYLKEVVKKGLEDIHKIAEAGALPRLIELLESPNVFIQGEAVEVLGDIIYESTTLRNEIIKLGFMKSLIKLLNSDAPPVVMKKVAKATAELLPNKYLKLSNEIVAELTPVLIKLLYHEDKTVTNYIIQSLQFLLKTKEYQFMKWFIKNNRTKQIMANLEDPLKASMTLHFIHEIFINSPEHAHFLLQFGLLKSLKNYLNNFDHDDNILLFSLFVLDHLLENTTDHCQAIFNSKILPSIIFLFRHKNAKIKNLAVTIIMKFIQCGSQNHILTLLDMNIVNPFCNLMKNNKENDEILKFSLDSITVLLAKAEIRASEILKIIEECGGTHFINNLHSKNEKVKEAVHDLAFQYNDVIFWSKRNTSNESHDEL